MMASAIARRWRRDDGVPRLWRWESDSVRAVRVPSGLSRTRVLVIVTFTRPSIPARRRKSVTKELAEALSAWSFGFGIGARICPKADERLRLRATNAVAIPLRR